MNGLAEPVALALVRRYLSALRNYPTREDGEKRLAEILAGCVLGVPHAELVLECFDDECPTPREIRDTAANLKSKVAPALDPREQWKAEAVFQPLPRLVVVGDAERLNAEMWRRIAERLGTRDWARVSWAAIYAAMQDLGYPLNQCQREMMGGYTLPPRKPASREDPRQPAAPETKNGGG